MPELLVRPKDSNPRTVPLIDRAVTLGRSPENDLPFPADGVLSRKHVAIVPENGAWWVEDLGSKNGTLLNGIRLRSRIRLQPGDRIEAGAVTLQFDPPLQDLGQTVVFVPETAEQSVATAGLRLTLGEVVDKKDELDASLTAKSQAGTSRVQILLEAGRELAGHRPLDELFPLILSLAMRSVSAVRGVVLIEESGRLEVRAACGESFQISGSVRDRVMSSRESLLITDAAHDEQLRYAHSIVAGRVKSLMAVPLQTVDKVIGLIYLDSPDFIPFSAEDLRLLTVLANVAAVRIEHARLLEIEQADKVLQKELAQAAEIQASFFPRETPAVEGLTLAGFSMPCRSVGGDFFDYLHLPEGRLGVLIGDVAGKGLSAALLMSSFMARVQVLAEVTTDPGDLITRLNRIFSANCPSNRFVTFFLLVLDPATGEFTYCNAGHNPPYLRRAGGTLESLKEGGPVVGILKRFVYASASSTLHPGDAVVLFSDGLTEARSPADEEFGEERLEAMILKSRQSTASDLLTEIRASVEKFMSTAPSADDLTLVVVKR